MALVIGCSGWQYRDWRGVLYPPDLPQRAWLGRYAQAFSTVEVNNTFYRLPERETFEGWARQVPDGFVMAVKMSRFLTHMRCLANPEEPLARFLDRASGLGAHLGPVLVQLPPTMPARPEALEPILAGLSARVVIEPRHDSWFTDKVRALLVRYGAALCWGDRNGRPVTPLWTTADFGYLRLHGAATQNTRYGARTIDAWLRRVDSTKDFYIYFNNDHGGAAVANARMMIRRA